MKRKALLIGNTNGLPGVNIDLAAIRAFLQSNQGGAWFESEIQTVVNAEKQALLNIINSIKQQGCDYVFVHFSGHGGQELHTVLEINAKGERVYETDLFGLATRQVSIFDCCRAYPVPATKSRSLNMDSSTRAFSESFNHSRELYDTRVMQAIPQQVQMYGCSKGQSALDTAEGGVYTCGLLKEASRFNGSLYKTLNEVHQDASDYVKRYAQSKGAQQSPEIVTPRCLTSQQLILSVCT